MLVTGSCKASIEIRPERRHALTKLGVGDHFFLWPSSYCVTNFGICSEPRSMGNAIASWRERPPVSVALLRSSSERGVQAAMADLWTGNLGVRQIAGIAWWHNVLRGESSLARRSGNP